MCLYMFLSTVADGFYPVGGFVQYKSVSKCMYSTVQYSTPHTQSLQYSTVGVGLVLVLVSTSSIIAETAHPVRNSGFIVFSPTTYVVYELADGEKPE
jgi:hypothetical protein